jgi:hypothetical protein
MRDMAQACCPSRPRATASPPRAELGRPERDGRVAVAGTEPGGGPERKRYAITPDGVAALEGWLAKPKAPEPHLQPVLFTKVVLALLSGRPAATSTRSAPRTCPGCGRSPPGGPPPGCLYC